MCPDCPPLVTRDSLFLLLYNTPGSLSVSINYKCNVPHPLILLMDSALPSCLIMTWDDEKNVTDRMI